MPPDLRRRSSAVAGLSGALVAATGAVVLTAWRLGAPVVAGLSRDLPPMSPNTAACLLLGGASLLALRTPGSRPRRRAGRAGAAAVGLVGAAILSEYLWGLTSRIDYLLIAAPPESRAPMRASSYTAIGLMLASAALLSMDAKAPWRIRARDAFSLLALSIGVLALFGYGYGVEYLNTLPRLKPVTGMAVLTAISLVALSLGIMAARPENGLAAIITSGREGGLAARRLLTAVLIVEPALAMLAILGSRAGYYPISGAAAATLLSALVVIVASVFITAARLDRLDLIRERTAAALARQQEARAHLAAIVDSSSDAIVSSTLDGVITSWNKGAESLFGFGAEEVLGRSGEILVRAEQEPERRRNLERLRRGEKIEPYRSTRFRKGGEPVAVSVSASPVMNDAGQLIGIAGIMRDISETERIENELRRKSEEIEDLYENAPCGYHSLDERGLFVRVNATELSWLGYARDELVGKTAIADILAPQSREVFRRAFPAFKEAGAIRDLELELIRKDGSRLPVLVSATAVRDEDGRFLASRSTLYDRTELQRARDALEDSRAFSSALVENIPAMVVVKDARDLRLTLCNRAGLEILGRRSEEVLGKTDHDLFPKEQADFFVAKDREAMSGGIVVDIPEEPVRTSSGDRFLHTRKITLRDADGAPAHLLLIAEDVTERRRLAERERALAEERARVRFSLALESAASAMVMTDARGGIQFVNAQAERLFGYARGELVGRPVEVLVPQPYRKAHPAQRDGFVGGPADRRPMGAGRELFAVRKDGSSFPVEVGLTRLRMDEEIVVVASVIDITERVRAARELRESEGKLRESVAELEGFAYTVSHNLRSPLRAIQGYAAVVERQLGGRCDESDLGLLRKINRAAVRLDLMIRDLLSYSAVSRAVVTPEPVDLDAVVADAAEAHHPPLASSILRVRSPLGKVRAQRSLLLQAVSCLLDNAVKFVPPDRRPRIEVRGESRPGGVRRLVVSDNGVGVPREFRAKILEPFERLSHPGVEGTGIGLAIARKAAERMGGRLGLDSGPGLGSRFWIELPEA